MTTFQVGDIVKIQGKNITGVILEVPSPDFYKVDIRGGKWGYCRGQALSLVAAETATFQVGDRVEAVHYGTWKLGTITKDDHTSLPFYIEYDDGTTGWRNAETLRLLSRIVIKDCDCGGHSVGSHSHWCSNPSDNKPRNRGLIRKVTT